MANRKLARKGRYGDTEIRNVAGRKSHVNKQEAKAIDLYGMLGERLVQREGAGTINPRTRLPEYHWKANWKHMADHARKTKIGDVVDMINPSPVGAYEDITGKETGISTMGELIDDPSKKVVDFETVGDNLGITSPDDTSTDIELTGDFDKDAYMAAVQAGTDPETGINAAEEYLKKIGVPENKLDYFQSNINVDYLGEGGFLTQAKELTEAGATLSETTAGKLYGPEGEAYKGADIAYGIGKSAVTETRRAAGAQYGLGMEQAGLGARRSLFDIKQQGDVAAARSGLATSGTIAATTGRAQKGVFQDYTMQQKSLAEARGSAMTRADITMAGVTEARRGAKAGADISYGGVMGFGTEGEEGYVAGSADITRAGAGLAYETGVSDIAQSGEEEFWKNLMNVNQYG